MKGIIFKDLYDNFGVWKNLASYIFSFGIVLLVSLFSRSGYFYGLMVFMTALCGSAAIESSTEQDEISNFNRLLITFPVTKTEIIRAKYILALCFLGVANVFSDSSALCICISRADIYTGAALLADRSLRITDTDCIFLRHLFRFRKEKRHHLLLHHRCTPCLCVRGALVAFQDRYDRRCRRVECSRYPGYFIPGVGSALFPKLCLCDVALQKEVCVIWLCHRNLLLTDCTDYIKHSLPQNHDCVPLLKVAQSAPLAAHTT